MVELAALEARIRVLEDIEDIKKLKARYWNCLDRKLWDELSKCFADDAVASFGRHGKFEGRKAVMGFFSGSRSARGSDVGIHQGHNPEIDITGDSTARGTWQLFRYSINKQANHGGRSAAFYYDEYITEKGEWKILNLDYVHVFREEIDRTGISLLD